ncbi:ABC transporter substrate-binding protein [Amnibacterium flavum]|uniref:Solute-binding protein family 5 domain-containing protein n=1 Tax=Amnibacterium flavum TaxID=2173173 RepID=A0A2V1HQ30_9MICO|nr:ABC transporter substrate-binding protein [Amnibacterium flavum]PVZ93229.1 hypothetical protein DDQ50_16090 [Amnibacterium flavum]
MNGTRRKVMIAAVLISAGALSGCSASPNSAEGEKVLRLSLQAPPGSFAVGYDSGDAIILQTVYDTLLDTAVDGSIVEGVADEWSYDDTLTELSFHIRPGQSFTDGEDLDAAAVAASLEASRVGPSTASRLLSVSSVEAPDDETVVVRLSEPDGALISNLADVPGAVGAPSSLGTESAQTEPIGSGPYSLDPQLTTTGAKYVLVKNDENWNADAYPFDRVEFQVIADQTAALSAVRADQLDFAYLPSSDLLTQFDDPRYTTGTTPPSSLSVLWLADRGGEVVPALGDVRVRRAINLALDREGIAAAINPGLSAPTAQVVNPAGGAWSDALNETYPYDVDEARALLTEAGYPDGFAVTMPSTFASIQYEPIVTQSLADIGITVTWETVPFQDFYTKVFTKTYAMFLMGNLFRSSDAIDLNNSTVSVFNPFGTTNPEYEALLTQANASQAEDAFEPLNEYLVNEAWFAPITTAGGAYVVSSKIAFTPPKVLSSSIQPWTPAAS